MFADTEESIASIYSQNRICLKQYWQMCERGPGQCKASSAWSRTIAALQAEKPRGKRAPGWKRGRQLGASGYWIDKGNRTTCLYVCLNLRLSVHVMFRSVCLSFYWSVCLSILIKYSYSSNFWVFWNFTYISYISIVFHYSYLWLNSFRL